MYNYRLKLFHNVTHEALGMARPWMLPVLLKRHLLCIFFQDQTYPNLSVQFINYPHCYLIYIHKPSRTSMLSFLSLKPHPNIQSQSLAKAKHHGRHIHIEIQSKQFNCALNQVIKGGVSLQTNSLTLIPNGQKG